MRRQPSLRVAERNTDALRRLVALKTEHPFWGYRRCWAQLRYVDGLPVNKKRILRLLRAHDLLVTPNRRLRASRTPMTSKPKPTARNQWWGIDMTKVLVESFGWVYVVERLLNSPHRYGAGLFAGCSGPVARIHL